MYTSTKYFLATCICRITLTHTPHTVLLYVHTYLHIQYSFVFRWNEGGAILLLGLISVFFTALTFCFYGFGMLYILKHHWGRPNICIYPPSPSPRPPGCIGWIKFPDYVAYEEEYERVPSDATRWKSVLNSNTAMAVYGMTWPFIITTVLISFMYTNGVIKTRKHISSSLSTKPEKILRLMKDKDTWFKILEIAKKDSKGEKSVKMAKQMIGNLDVLINKEVSEISAGSFDGEQTIPIEMGFPPAVDGGSGL